MRYRILLLGLVVACGSKSSGGRRVRIAAAANLEKAWTELAKEFEAKTNIHAEISFGSSGTLEKQIEQGAPFFLFAAANTGFAEQAIKSGKCDAKTAKVYARGRIVVWTAPGMLAPVKLEDLAKPEFKKIAIANPERAPYGKAAQQALTKAGVWDAVQPKVVLGDNIEQTMIYAKEKNVDAAIVALSLAVTTEGGTTLQIDGALHDPVDQELVVCGAGEEADAAKQFIELLDTREGREVMQRYGYEIPGTQAQK